MKKNPNLVVMLIIFAVTALIYARAAGFPFSAIDDHVYVTGNPRVILGFSLDSLRWAFTSFYAANWHPVTWLSLMLDGELFGMNPAGYHLVNVALHAANSALLYLLFSRMTGARGRSLFVAACFALHPLHVESVAWISERKDVLSTLLLLLTLLFYLSYQARGKMSSYYLSLAAFAVGLMAKAMLVTLPVLLLLLDFWPLRRLQLPLADAAESGPAAVGAGSRGGKRLVLEKIPFLLLAAVSSLVTVAAQGSGAAVATLTQIPLLYRINNALWSTLQYLKMSVFPFDLAVYYPYVLVPLWKAGLALVLLIVISMLALKYWNRCGYLALGWFWYLVTLLPVIGVVQVGSQAMADRYTYVPYIGLFIMAAWGGAELAGKMKLSEKSLRLAGGAVLLFFAVVTSVQLSYWHDNERLLKRTLSITEKNYFTHFALGGFYEEQGQMDLAMAQYWEVLRINPGAKGVHLYLGRALARQGEANEAIGYLQEALRREPGVASAHFYLGVCLEKLGKIADSTAAYQEATKLEPENPRYHTNFGAVLARQGRLDDAIQSFTTALQLDPKDRKAAEYLQLANSLKSGRDAK